MRPRPRARPPRRRSRTGERPRPRTGTAGPAPMRSSVDALPTARRLVAAPSPRPPQPPRRRSGGATRVPARRDPRRPAGPGRTADRRGPCRPPRPGAPSRPITAAVARSGSPSSSASLRRDDRDVCPDIGVDLALGQPFRGCQQGVRNARLATRREQTRCGRIPIDRAQPAALTIEACPGIRLGLGPAPGAEQGIDGDGVEVSPEPPFEPVRSRRLDPAGRRRDRVVESIRHDQLVGEVGRREDLDIDEAVLLADPPGRLQLGDPGVGLAERHEIRSEDGPGTTLRSGGSRLNGARDGGLTDLARFPVVTGTHQPAGEAHQDVGALGRWRLRRAPAGRLRGARPAPPRCDPGSTGCTRSASAGSPPSPDEPTHRCDRAHRAARRSPARCRRHRRRPRRLAAGARRGPADRPPRAISADSRGSSAIARPNWRQAAAYA